METIKIRVLDKMRRPWLYLWQWLGGLLCVYSDISQGFAVSSEMYPYLKNITATLIFHLKLISMVLRIHLVLKARTNHSCFLWECWMCLFGLSRKGIPYWKNYYTCTVRACLILQKKTVISYFFCGQNLLIHIQALQLKLNHRPFDLFFPAYMFLSIWV